MPITPQQAQALLVARDAEHAETAALDLIDRDPDTLVPAIIAFIGAAGRAAVLSEQPKRLLLYHTVWLGWERVLTAWHARHEDEPPFEQDDDDAQTVHP